MLVRPEHGMAVIGVGLVVDLHQYVPAVQGFEELDAIYDCPPEVGIVSCYGHAPVLAEIEEADDDDHPVAVGSGNYVLEAFGVSGLEVAFGIEPTVIVGLSIIVGLSAEAVITVGGSAALEIHGKGHQSGAAPLGQCGDELPGVALRVPFSGIG